MEHRDGVVRGARGVDARPVGTDGEGLGVVQAVDPRGAVPQSLDVRERPGGGVALENR